MYSHALSARVSPGNELTCGNIVRARRQRFAAAVANYCHYPIVFQVHCVTRFSASQIMCLSHTSDRGQVGYAAT
jgi:hypothetical protein